MCVVVVVRACCSCCYWLVCPVSHAGAAHHVVAAFCLLQGRSTKTLKIRGNAFESLEDRIARDTVTVLILEVGVRARLHP